MPRQKPSVEKSIVPDFARDYVRRRQMQNRIDQDLEQMYRSGGNRPARPEAPLAPSDDIKKYLEDNAMPEDEMGSPVRMAKGGMVRGYKKGGMVQVRGQGKARSKPCKIC